MGILNYPSPIQNDQNDPRSGDPWDQSLPISLPTALSLLNLPKSRQEEYLRQPADEARQSASGNRVVCRPGLSFFLTNICELKPSIHRYPVDADHPRAFVLTVDDIDQRLESFPAGQGRVMTLSAGGFHSGLSVPGLEGKNLLDGYGRILRHIKEQQPLATCEVASPDEIAFLAVVSDRSCRYVLDYLRDRGMNRLGGWHAYILDDRIRRRISAKLLSVHDWSSVVETAHRIHLPVHATALFGHLERPDHRVKHLLGLRRLLGRYPGVFSVFTPLMMPLNAQFQLDANHSPAGPVSPLTGHDHLVLAALSRLILGQDIPDGHGVPELVTPWRLPENPDAFERDALAAAVECLNWGADSLGSYSPLAFMCFAQAIPFDYHIDDDRVVVDVLSSAGRELVQPA
jgi:2-iminoacetate synthase ThiH